MSWDTSIDWTAPLTRRSALRGAGAVLALPFLESWVHALGKAAGLPAKLVRPPLRFGIYTVTGGTVLESWRMKEAGPLSKKLPSILRPLEFARDDLLLVTGLSHGGESEDVNGHENCAFKHLTGAPKVGKSGGKPFAGISVDQAAARAVGGSTYLPSMEFGLTSHETRFSFRSADQLLPYEDNPQLVFDRMFRGRSPIVPNWQRRAASAGKVVRDSAPTDSYERSVVDAVNDESKSLRGRLGTADKHKLDEYLEAVRSVETRIGRLEALLKLEAADAKDPGPSKLVSPTLPDRKTPWHKHLNLIYRDPEKHGEYIRVMSDLMVMAFQTNTTRVATFACGSDEASFPGVVTVGYETHCHTLEHQGNQGGQPENADPIAREALRQIHAWYTGLFAEAVRKMKAIDEGGSSLLDNTLLMYTSYMADGGHGTEDYPILLAGKAQGTLKTGRQVSFPKQTPASNLYLELLHRMGANVKTFGDSHTSKQQRYDGRLPGLI